MSRPRDAAVAAVVVLAACGRPRPASLTREPGIVLFIAPDGDDRWTGQLDVPNAARSDGPLASLEAARDRARALRGAKLPIAIELRGGRYARHGALELGPDDSGAPDAPIVYRARPGDAAILDGGRSVTGLAPVTDPAILARLDPAARDRVRVVSLAALGVDDAGPVDGGGLELFFDHRAMPLARWPDQGFVTIPGVVELDPVDVRGTRGDRAGVLRYDGDRPRRWLAEPDPWAHGYWFWDWADQRERIAAIDPAHHTLAMAPPLHHYGYRAGQWYYAFNLLAELDAPGEWYVDRRAHLLYFWPPGAGDTEVSVAPQLLVIDGAHDVTVRGLTFQASRGDAVAIHGGERVAITDCTLRDLGGWAVVVTGGHDVTVARSELAELGGGGIRLDGGDRRALAPGRHRALANHIHDYSRGKRMNQAAIELIGVGHEARDNHIHDAPHIAIAFSGNDHTLAGNVIERVCQEANDAGAISAGRDWTMRGTVIAHNVLRDIHGFRNAGCNGVMLDDLFSGTQVIDNTFERVSRGIIVGGGRDNTIDGNTFRDCDTAIRLDARGEGWAAYSIAESMRPALDAMPYRDAAWARYPHLANLLDDDPAAPRYNRITRNVTTRCKLDDIDPRARPLVELSGNREAAP